MKDWKYKKVLALVALLLPLLIVLSLISEGSVDLVTPTAADSIEIDEQSSELLETFLAYSRNEEMDKAYELTSADFRGKVSMKQFETLLEDTGMDDFREKKWLTFDSSNPNFHSIIRAEFIEQDLSVHNLSFALSEEEGGLEVASIAEDVSLEGLADRFPKEEELEALIRKDVAVLLATVENKTYEEFYHSLSAEAQSVVSLEELQSGLENFEKEGKNLQFDENSELELEADFPKMTNEGKVQVIGTYENAEYLVEFFLEYVYEWGWVLNAVDIDGKLIN